MNFKLKGGIPGDSKWTEVLGFVLRMDSGLQKHGYWKRGWISLGIMKNTRDCLEERLAQLDEDKRPVRNLMHDASQSGSLRNQVEFYS